MMGLFYESNKDIVKKLESLDRKRNECQGKIDEKTKTLEENKNKITRLESALVNPNQISASKL